MKKFFFFAAALMVSAAAMATAEVYTPSQTDYPTEQEAKDGAAKTAVEAGTVFYTGTAFDVKNAFATTYQRVGLAANQYSKLTMNGVDIVANADQWGIQGNDNPKDADGGNPALTNVAPSQGAVYQVDVKQDGVIYVFHKASSNKHYTVFEIYGTEATSLGYDFAMITCPGDAEANKGKVAWLAGILCKDIITDSLITYNPTVDADGYVVSGGIVFPEIPMLREDVPTYGKIADSTLVQKNGAYARNGLGVIAFPVAANTSYYVNACGSKMSLAAIAFETEAVTVKVSDGTNEIELYTREAVTTAVENVEAVKVNKVIENGMLIIEKNGVRYNALGQKL